MTNVVKPTGDLAAVRFLEALRPNGGSWTLSAIYPDDAPPVDGDTGKVPTKTFTDTKVMGEWIARRNGRANIYYAPNPTSSPHKKATKAEVQYGQFAHVEIDEADGVHLAKDPARKAQVVERLLASKSPGPPTFIIDSGGGVQALWRLEGSGVKQEHFRQLEAINRRLVQDFGGDAKTYNVDRILRLPGTWNLPDATKRARGRVPAQATLLSEKAVAYDPALEFGEVPPLPARVKPVTVTFGDAVFIDDLEELTNRFRLPEKLIGVIRDGDPTLGDGTSSASCWYATHELLGHAVPHELILGLLMDSRYQGIHEHVAKNPRGVKAYAERLLTQAINRRRANRVADFGDGDDSDLPLPPLAASIRSKVDIKLTGTLDQDVDHVIDALREHGSNIYQMSGRLVQLIHHNVPPPRENDVSPRRPAGALILHEVGETLLTELIASAADFYRLPKPKASQTDADPTWAQVKAPSEFARHLIARGEWPLRILRGTVETPTLRPDGTLVQAEGYDEESGLYLDLNSVEFPAIEDAPSHDDALAAMEALVATIATFPFVAVEGELDNGPTASRSVALSAMLTAVIRRSLGTAPAHAIVAPTPGTGKTKLAEIAAALAIGRKPTAISYGKTQEEFEKRLFSVLLTGDAVVVVDNIEADAVASDEFCSILTSEKIKNRILGLSKMSEVSTNSLFILNGNNVTFRGDIVDRVVICNLDARMEDPKLRTFKYDPVTFAIEQRPDLVAAVLTVLHAHAVAGFPGAVGLTSSRFPDWDRIVRGALIWLGQPDPQITRDALAVADPVREVHTGLMRAWKEAVGAGFKIGAGELVKRAEAISDEELEQIAWPSHTMFPDDAAEGLHAGLVAAVGVRFNAQTTGIYLGKMVNRVFDGLAIRSKQDKKRGATYWLEVS